MHSRVERRVSTPLPFYPTNLPPLPPRLPIPSRRSRAPVLSLSLSFTPFSLPRRGRKLCRWRRKALINTTVSDRYADPRHCKMAAISPSHSSGRQPPPHPHPPPAPASHSPLDPRGCFSFSLTAGTPCHPHLAPPQLAFLIFTPRPRRRRRHRHPKSRGWKYAPFRRLGSSNASAPGRTTRYIYALRFHWKILVPLEEPHAQRTHTRSYPPTHTRPCSSSSSPRVPPTGCFGIPGSHGDTREKAYTLYPHP